MGRLLFCTFSKLSPRVVRESVEIKAYPSGVAAFLTPEPWAAMSACPHLPVFIRYLCNTSLSMVLAPVVEMRKLRHEMLRLHTWVCLEMAESGLELRLPPGLRVFLQHRTVRHLPRAVWGCSHQHVVLCCLIEHTFEKNPKPRSCSNTQARPS